MGLVPDHIKALKPYVAGKSKKEFKAGQNYRKSEVLLKIDSKEFLANVKQSRTQLQNLVASVLPDIKLDFPEALKNPLDLLYSNVRGALLAPETRF